MFTTSIDEALGVIYSKESSVFKIWSPTAESVVLNLYKAGKGDNLISRHILEKNEKGLWACTLDGDYSSIYYTYSINIQGVENEVVDIYAKAAGANGNRGMIVDLSATEPDDFRNTKPSFFEKITDAVIYEVHVRDFSIDESSGIKYKGKFLGFTETDTKNASGDSTGLSHLKELGVTHIHLLPSFDYETVDEESDEPQYNWGYDPKNYNVPEGSYSTDAVNGAVRIREFKQLVKALHQNGLRVVMDVVYNHTFKGADSFFNLTVPDYYYRKENGKLTNGSACGNETSSKNLMMRKFMLDSIKFWAKEYMIDGFRFDLMGLHDIVTMNQIKSALDEIDPSIIVYGEGWVADYTPLSEEERAIKSNAGRMPDISFFNDNIRDSIKGSVFNIEEKGFVNGGGNNEENIKLCVTGTISSNLVDISKTDFKPWALSPSQSINYTEVHDNLTLWDKLFYSAGQFSVEDRIRMDKLAACIVFLSQGVPLIHAGQEFLRSKPLDDTGLHFSHNSYNLPDSVNSIKWNNKSLYKNVYSYYKGLIEIRKKHSLFRLSTADEVVSHLTFIPNNQKGVVVFRLKNIDEELIVIFNANKNSVVVDVPNAEWGEILDYENAGNDIIRTIKSNKILVPYISAMVLKKNSMIS